jgi:membrane-bound serine protease (ClpP class)
MPPLIEALASANGARHYDAEFMSRRLSLSWLCLFLAVLTASAEHGAPAALPVPAAESGPTTAAAEPAKAPRMVTVYVLPVREEIARPVLYILRRGLKEAIEKKADAVVLDMETPGGALDVTFEIMEALGKFPGQTITFVDKEAVSAGAFISATTQEIWFAPEGVIGAAAPVLATGQDIDETMKLKIVSYLKARVRAISEGKGYRGQVISAMIDKDFELKIGDVVIKAKGELLSLTAHEAAKTYGTPPESLLAAGIAKNIDDLLRQKYGAGNYQVIQLEVTWSERLAQYLNAIAPVLLGLGIVCLFIEFKTPGFGFFGFAGIALLAIVFLGHYVAGFSGHEPVLFFGLGVVLVAIELFFFPGVAVLAVSGIILMLGSLLWAMADIWPNEPIRFTGDVFVQPLVNLGLGLVIAITLIAVLARYLPKGWVWDRLVVVSTVGGAAQIGGVASGAAPGLAALVGRRGIAATALRPIGQVEIDGLRYEAKVEVGAVDAGAAVIVRGRTDFSLIVEKIEA